MAFLTTDMPWLPAAPADFAQQCETIGRRGAPGEDIRRLSTARLTPRQMMILNRAIARVRDEGGNAIPDLANFRLGILSSATFELLLDCLPTAAARHGVALEVVNAPYGQVMQQAFEQASAINTGNLDASLLSVDHRWLALDRADLVDAQGRLDSAVELLQTAAEHLRENSGAPVIFQTLATPPTALFGSFDRRARGTVLEAIGQANQAIVELAEQTGGYLLDVGSLAERIGSDRWFDPARWAAYKLPFAAECFPPFADLLGRLLGAIRGKARKCLVLDLDNTLWGGVIGDDGLDGIKVGQGDEKGEAFLSIQQTALELRARGVILAVCSKNDEYNARLPFQKHPEMLLKEEHISVFQANWADKPSNLQKIAETLNIGLDALVLLDDNPAERAQIRAALPMVGVPELPEDPSWFPWFLNSAGYFESVSFSAEDANRAQSYLTNVQRAAVQSSSRDLGDYLSALKMVSQMAPFDAQSRTRVTQLINKTNQFNLTTRRYIESEVADFEADPNTFTLQVRLKDAFGDLGLIAVAIARPTSEDSKAWEIDTWLMSCRVLGRRVEEAMLAKIVEEARKNGIERIIGVYIRTSKNQMVADLFPRLGFDPYPAGADRWTLSVHSYAPPALPIARDDRFA